MATAEQARKLLLRHGMIRPQPASDWTGAYPLPSAVERYYQEIGPADVRIKSYGNPFFLPSLAALWQFQAGFRWNGLTGDPIQDWPDDWLVVADEGGDPFISSGLSGRVMHDVHGQGVWEPAELFPDLETMAACLGHLGAVVTGAGHDFTDEDSGIRRPYRDEALAGLRELLGSSSAAESVLAQLGWNCSGSV